jgi:hypothetical protein
MHKTHGRSNTSEYHIWRSMKDRCYNPNGSHYKYYGARGIEVCDRWIKDFTAFYLDMGVRPVGMSIDRIDNDGNYCPENCKWSTASEQQLNTSHNKLLDYQGQKIPLYELARIIGMSGDMLQFRISRGWDIKDALNPRMDFKPNTKLWKMHGVVIQDLDDAVNNGISKKLFGKRIKAGWSIYDSKTKSPRISNRTRV